MHILKVGSEHDRAIYRKIKRLNPNRKKNKAEIIALIYQSDLTIKQKREEVKEFLEKYGHGYKRRKTRTLY